MRLFGVNLFRTLLYLFRQKLEVPLLVFNRRMINEKAVCPKLLKLTQKNDIGLTLKLS